jgi:hypothetical protein
MSVDIKVAADDKLQLVQTYFTDNSPSSDFFNITELPDTLSGGKNAFLIAGSDKLFPQSEVKVQVRDAAGNVCYVEYADGNPEYYEGISKVVAVYVYPNQTAFGPATITVLGQAIDVPDEWQFRFNVKWQKTININPSLPNTTRVRFYKRPKVDIVETLEPIYRIESGSKVASGVTASFANIKISELETFAGDVKRVKVFRTSDGDISDFDLIQDILIESKELLTTFDITSSVKGNAGIFTNETLKLWNTGSLTASLTNDRLDNGLRLKGRGIFKYNSPLSFVTKSTYEFNLDAFYSSSTNSNLGVYISGSNNGIQLIGTLEGTIPVKNLEDSYFTFDVDKNEPTASLYLSQSQNEWHVANVSLKLSEDSAFSPNQINFISTMPTVIGNERYNFKFEFYDVNNNFVPVAVTQSALFTGGNNNIGGTLILISGSVSSSNAALLEVSRSVSGTISFTSQSVSSSLSNVSSSISGTISTVSSSVSASKAAAISSSFGNIQTLANGNFSGSFISDTTIFAPVIGGNNGYISNLFKVGTAPSIYLDARQNPRKIFIGGVGDVGSYNSGSTTVYMDSSGKFSLGNKLTWDGNALTLAGSINITGGQAATDIANAASSGSNALTYAIANNTTASIATTNLKIFTDAAGLVNRTATPVGSGLYMDSSHLGYYKSGAGWATFMSSSGLFYLSGSAGNSLLWNGSGLEIRGAITATSITLISGVKIPNDSVDGLGSLALKSSVSATTDVTDLGTLATRNTVNETHIDDNSISTGKILANSIVAGKIASLEFFGKNARFDTGSIAGWNFNGNSLFKSNGTHTISLSSADASYFITRDSTNQTKVKISPDTTIAPITINAGTTDSINYQSPNQVRFTVTGTGTQSLTTMITATSGRGDTDGGLGYAGTGIIFLENPTEEIWVDSDGEFGLTLLQFLGTISVNGNSVNTNDDVNADYSLTLVAEKYSNYTNAANRTNIIQTYRATIAETGLFKFAGDPFSYTDYTYNISGGGFQVDSNSNWFYVYLEQKMDLSTADWVGIGEEEVLSISMVDYGASIKVQFGRVDNGFSQLSPAGLQVYTGVRTYMNASVSGAPGESFFEVKGKSQFLSGLSVNGTFSATNKQFQITHPLNKNKWLYHTSIEGPQADLIYRGKLNLINGEGSSNIDVSSRLTNGTFNSLTRNPQLFLQNNDSFDRIKGKIENGNVYVVSENQNSSASVDWTVIAERCDTEVLTGGTYGGDGKYKTEKWKREFRNSLAITGSI